jgi:hypothetical protein
MIVLVPTALPPDFGRVYQSYFSGTPYAEPGGYLVVLGAVPACDGATACAYGTIEGRPGLHLPAGKIVMIAGRRNVVDEHPCGANCAGSFTATFLANGATYIVSLKAGTLKEAAIIEGGLRPQRRTPAPSRP